MKYLVLGMLAVWTVMMYGPIMQEEYVLGLKLFAIVMFWTYAGKWFSGELKSKND